jgi:hypothetical protein
MGRASAVGISTGYGLGDRGSRSSSSSRIENFLISASSRHVLRQTQPPYPVGTGTRTPVPTGGRGVRPTTHLQLMPRSRERGPICLNGVMLIQLSTGATFNPSHIFFSLDFADSGSSVLPCYPGEVGRTHHAG